MTEAETLATAIAALGLLVAIGSAAIAGLALRRTDLAEKREREAIVVVREVWSGTPGLDNFMIPPRLDRGQPGQLIQGNPRPAEPERRFVIAMESSGGAGVLVRQSDNEVELVLRLSTVSDDADKDGPGGRNAHYVMLEVQNIGRWAAVDVRISCTIEGAFLNDFDEGTNKRRFPSQLTFEALQPDKPRFVQIRNMTGLPISLAFHAVSAVGQSARLAPVDIVDFQPRGYRS